MRPWRAWPRRRRSSSAGNIHPTAARGFDPALLAVWLASDASAAFCAARNSTSFLRRPVRARARTRRARKMALDSLASSLSASASNATAPPRTRRYGDDFIDVDAPLAERSIGGRHHRPIHTVRLALTCRRRRSASPTRARRQLRAARPTAAQAADRRWPPRVRRCDWTSRAARAPRRPRHRRGDDLTATPARRSRWLRCAAARAGRRRHDAVSRAGPLGGRRPRLLLLHVDSPTTLRCRSSCCSAARAGPAPDPAVICARRCRWCATAWVAGQARPLPHCTPSCCNGSTATRRRGSRSSSTCPATTRPLPVA